MRFKGITTAATEAVLIVPGCQLGCPRQARILRLINSPREQATQPIDSCHACRALSKNSQTEAIINVVTNIRTIRFSRREQNVVILLQQPALVSEKPALCGYGI
jgi:hypothetical protein